MGHYEIPADKKNYIRIINSSYITPTAHFHNAVELLFVQKGTATAFINGVKYDLKKGDGVFSNSFDMHYYLMQENSEYTVIVISDDYLTEFKNYAKGGVIANNFSATEEDLLFIQEWYKTYEKENRLLLTSKVLRVLSLLNIDKSLSARQKKKDDFASAIFKYIHENYKEKLTVEFLAQTFGYSRGYISTMFSSYSGENFNSYLNRIRVIKVKEELNKNDKRTVLDIAFSNGFDSANTFYRAYKKQFGETPTNK